LKVRDRIIKQAPENIPEKHTLAIIPMKTFASSSDRARIAVRSSFDNRNDRNKFRKPSDFGSGGR
jgi:hypothetical protein